jgi:hypothetical protein
MKDNEKLVAIMEGDWKDASVAFMIVPSDSVMEDRRDHNIREFPELSFEEYLEKLEHGRPAGNEEIELYATGIDPNRNPSLVRRD